MNPERVARIFLFADLAAPELERVARAASEQPLAAGEHLFRMGDPATHCYVVLAGCVQLSRVNPDGDEKVIAVVNPGESFGEALMFGSRTPRYPVDARAIRDAEVAAFAIPALREVLQSSTDACFRVMGSMSRRLHELVMQIDEITLHNATYRLVQYLLNQLPRGAAHAPDIQLTIPKLVIASRLSIQPETFSRILARLRRDGLIDTDGAHIVLRDVEALERLID